MSRAVFLLLVIAVATSTIPPTVIDAGTWLWDLGSIVITAPWTNPLPYAVNFNVVFERIPSFALLLHGFSVDSGNNGYGFLIQADTITSVNAKFNVTNPNNSNFWRSIKVRWAASQGEHLQMFRTGLRLQRNYSSLTQLSVIFDYPSLVKWSSGSFEVGIALVLSFFNMAYDGSKHLADFTIAKWNGVGYGYSGSNRFVLQKDALYGPNCPFSQQSGFNVIRLYGKGS